MPTPPQQHIENCKELFGLLSQYLDVELPGDICEQIEAHLSGCEPCVEFVESLKRTIQLCREYRLGESPGTLSDQARQQLRAAYHDMLVGRKGPSAV